MMGRIKHAAKQIITLPEQIAQFQEQIARLEWLEQQLEAKQRLNALYMLQQAGSTVMPSVVNQYELSIASQNGEDGILFFLFSLIGSTNRYFVEFGIEDGRECNTANLSIHFGWRGLLIEGSAEYSARARAYYDAQLREDRERVQIANALIQPDNINRLFTEKKVPPEIDLLSIDIDGNDYWVWHALDATSPRVVVIEYNASFGPERSLTVEYDPAFDRWKKHDSGYYHGASLSALNKLANAKGYALVGCDRRGVNAFFVQEDALTAPLRKLPPQEAFFPHFQRIESVEEQFARMQHLPFAAI
jgi:hypothetical protein